MKRALHSGCRRWPGSGACSSPPRPHREYLTARHQAPLAG
jgi:hypothetical protein